MSPGPSPVVDPAGFVVDRPGTAPADPAPDGSVVDRPDRGSDPDPPWFLPQAWRFPGSTRPPAPSTSRPPTRALEALPLLAVVAAALLTVALPVLVWTGTPWPGRPVLALLFVLLVPGVPITLALRLPDRRLVAVLSPCLGLATVMITGTVGSTVGPWSPSTAVSIQAAVSALFLPSAVVRVLRRRPTGRQWWSGAAALGRRWPVAAVLAGSLLLWWASTRTADLTGGGADGVLSILPWTYWAALALTCGALAVALGGRRLDPIAAGLATAVLAVQLLAWTSVTAGAGGPGAAWVHVGFIDAIERTGSVVLGADARFSWPGFLAGSAQLQTWADLPSVAGLLDLAPVVFTLLALPGLWLIGRSITGGDRGAWVTTTLALATTWMQQDYFSSQAVAYLGYIAVLATLLVLWDRAAKPRVRWWQAYRRVPGRPAGVGGGSIVALELLLVVIVAGMVVSHQLTPVMTVLVLLVTAVTGSTRLRGLPVAALALFVGWFSYGAADYWTGHLGTVVGDIGQVGSSVTAGVTARLAGDPAYLQWQYLRMGWTGALVLTAMVGLVLLRHRPGAVWWAGLAGAPGALVLLQSYGGEVVLRVAVYGAPIWCSLAAVTTLAVARAVHRRRPTVVLPVAAVLLLLATSVLTITRGLNVAFERVSPVQVTAARELLTLVPTGAAIGWPESVGPLPLGRVGEVTLVELDEFYCSGTVLDCDPALLPEFLFLTAPMTAKGVLQEGKAPDWDRQLVDGLLARGGWTVLVDTPEVTVLAHTGGSA